VSYGAIVIAVDPDGPGARAGIKVGDVIVRFGKQAPKDARALTRIVAAAIGDTAPMVVWRDRKEQTMTVTVGEWPEEQQSPGDTTGKLVTAVHTDLPDLGLQTAAITDEARTKYKLAEKQTGVVITGVTPASVADQVGLAAGDVILRVQQTPVATAAEMLAQFNDVRAAQRQHVVLLVQDHKGLRWIPLYVGAK
jgi:serine protease Do